LIALVRDQIPGVDLPVITMGEFTHEGSKKQLLGDNPTADMVKLMSNEEQVSKEKLH
jgi:hypothetical protein